MTNGCRHEHFAGEIAVTYVEERQAFRADVRISCADCGERFRFPGVPIGVHTGAPSVSMDGLELRLPIEEASRRDIETDRPFSAQRFALVADPDSKGQSGVAHDRWNMGAGCREACEATAQAERLVYKPALPQGYRLCHLCRMEAQLQAELRRDRAPANINVGLAIESPIDVAQRLEADVAAGRAAHAAAVAASTPPAPPEPPQEPVTTSATPVAPLPPEEGDDESTEGEPRPATAAVVLMPGDGGAAGAGNEPELDVPQGQLVPRSRGRGRNR